MPAVSRFGDALDTQPRGVSRFGDPIDDEPEVSASRFGDDLEPASGPIINTLKDVGRETHRTLTGGARDFVQGVLDLPKALAMIPSPDQALFRAFEGKFPKSYELNQNIPTFQLPQIEEPASPINRGVRDFVSIFGAPGAAFGALSSIKRVITKPKPKQPKPASEMSLEEAKEIQDGFQQSFDQMVNKAGNINLKRIAAGEDVKNVIRATEVVEAETMAAARNSPQTFEAIEDLAHSMGMTVDDFLALDKTASFSTAAEALAGRNLVVSSASAIQQAARRYPQMNPSERLAFQRLFDQHVAITETLQGKTAEAGRVLGIYRKMAEAGPLTNARTLEALSKGARSEDDMEMIARMISSLDDPDAVSALAMKAAKPTTTDVLLEVWINGLLSGPRTHATNILSNSLVASYTVPETFVAGTIGKGRDILSRAIGKGPVKDRVYMNEFVDRAYGLAQGGREGLSLARRSFIEEAPVDQIGKVELRRQRSMPGPVGRVVRFPGDMLLAEDEFFKSIGRRQTINALARRKTYQEFADGKIKRNEVGRRMQELTRNPTDEMYAAAADASHYQTFTKPLGPAGQKFTGIVNDIPVLRLIAPFIRTPTNIVKFFGERTPLAPLSKRVRDEFAAGGARRDIASAKIGLGAGIMATAYMLADEGMITGGGPSDPRKKAALYETGWQPYSIKVGNEYHTFGRLEPLGMLFGVAADAHFLNNVMTDEEVENVGALITFSISNNILSKTWTTGVADAIQAVEDPERYGDRYARGLVGSVVPSIVAQFQSARDPALYEARSILDQVRARAGIETDTLYPRQNIWGENIERAGGPDVPGDSKAMQLLSDFMSPVRSSKQSDDKTKLEVARLDLAIGKPGDTIRDVELTDEQRYFYHNTAGRLAKVAIDRLVNTEAYDDLPDYERRQIIQNVFQETRAAARAMTLRRYSDTLLPEIGQAFREKRQ